MFKPGPNQAGSSGTTDENGRMVWTWADGVADVAIHADAGLWRVMRSNHKPGRWITFATFATLEEARACAMGWEAAHGEDVALSTLTQARSSR